MPQVIDIADLSNQAAAQMGEGVPTLNADLSNIVDFGRALTDIFGTDGYDVFFGKLADRFNSVKFWSEPYVSFAPSIRMETHEFGAIRAMYKTGYLDAVDAPAWNLQEGMSYDQDRVYKTSVKATFWDEYFSFMIQPITVPSEGLRTAFTNAAEYRSFLGMIETYRNSSHTRAWDNQIMFVVQALIAQAIDSGGLQDIKLITEFNTLNPDNTVTAANALYNEAFIRYCVYRIGVIQDKMRFTTTFFNRNHRLTQTPTNRQKSIFISDFARAAGVYLHDGLNQFNTGNLNVPAGDVVPAWQGFGENLTLADAMSINTTLNIAGSPLTVSAAGILGVVYDAWGCGVTAYDHIVSTHYNKLGHFTNYFDQTRGGFFMDADANVVVFRLV